MYGKEMRVVLVVKEWCVAREEPVFGKEMRVALVVKEWCGAREEE